MSAQAYTNKLRLFAEASLIKVQYPGKVCVNNNPIYGLTNFYPDFRVLQYYVNQPNVVTTPPLTQITTPVTGGGAVMSPSAPIINGASASSVPTSILNGGNAFNP